MSGNERVESLKTACLVCGRRSYYIKTVEGFDIFKCSECRLEFCRPMPTPDQFSAFYTAYTDPRAPAPVTLANAGRNIDILANFGLTGQSRLLDYGSGRGMFCRAGNSPNWFNYDAYTGDNDASVLKRSNYDWVTLWGVLEHVADPVGLFQNLSAYLKGGGLLALTTVSIESSIPYQHKPPEHVSYWTRQALETALERANFEVIDYRPYKMVQNSDVYMDAVLRTVPEHLREKIGHTLPETVEVPTNEMFVVARLARAGYDVDV